MARRIRWLGLGMVLCFLVLLVQLNNIQVVKAHQYATDPNNPTVIAEAQQPRGAIQSADSVVLAQTKPAPANSGYKYERVYNKKYATLFSQIVGVHSNLFGNYGVEASYNSYLVAHNKPVTSLKDLLTTGAPITDTVTLTVSTTLEQAAATALAGRVGAIVALDPQSGAVLAMYSNPTYDPNSLASPNGQTEQFAFSLDSANDAQGYSALRSEAYQDIFFPGSTFKTVTTAAAYDRAPVLVNTPMPEFSTIPEHYFQGQTTTLSNDEPGPCGGTIAQMLPPSCDTGYAILGTKIGAPNMIAEADAFGFNSQPPIDLPPSPYEISQFLQPSCYGGAQVFLAFSSIGQDCTKASTLQMAMVASAFADGGVIMTPHVMSAIHDSEGNLVEQFQPTPWKQATSAGTATAVVGLMRQVVTDPNGTAAGVGFPPQDLVAAKTGTAQQGNSTHNTTDWMIALAPADHPTVAIAVTIPNQEISATGAEVAGPVMKAMIEAALAAPS